MKYDYEINLEADNSLSYIINQIAPHSNVLEFGPAKGYMTRILVNQKECSVSCVEIDVEAAKITEPFSQRMFVGDLDELLWVEELAKGAPYDYLVFADVLEHLKQPETVLKAAVAMLKEDGEVLTSIPNMGHAAVILGLLRGEFEYQSVGLLDNTHLKFYTKKSIQRLLEHSGLTPVKWMTTRSLPDQTEIKTSYYDVPTSVAEFIKDNPESHVYQYITVSKKHNDGNTIVSEVKNGEFLFSNYAQIFFSNPYEERFSIKLGLETPWGNQVLKAHIPGTSAGRPIRIDPTNFPAFISISKVSFFSLKRELLLEWPMDEVHRQLKPLNQLHALSNGMGLYESYWIAVGNDPHWEICLPDIQGDFILEFHMHTLSSQTELLKNILDSMDNDKQKNRVLEEELLAKGEEYKKLLYERDSLSNAVQTLDKTRSELETKISKIINSKTWRWTGWLRRK